MSGPEIRPVQRWRRYSGNARLPDEIQVLAVMADWIIVAYPDWPQPMAGVFVAATLWANYTLVEDWPWPVTATPTAKELNVQAIAKAQEIGRSLGGPYPMDEHGHLIFGVMP